MMQTKMNKYVALFLSFTLLLSSFSTDGNLLTAYAEEITSENEIIEEEIPFEEEAASEEENPEEEEIEAEIFDEALRLFEEEAMLELEAIEQAALEMMSK